MIEVTVQMLEETVKEIEEIALRKNISQATALGQLVRYGKWIADQIFIGNPILIKDRDGKFFEVSWSK